MNKKESLMKELNEFIEKHNLHPNTVEMILKKERHWKTILPKHERKKLVKLMKNICD